jgi:hypothetical protein
MFLPSRRDGAKDYMSRCGERSPLIARVEPRVCVIGRGHGWGGVVVARASVQILPVKRRVSWSDPWSGQMAFPGEQSRSW